MSSAKSHLSELDSIARIEEKLCEDEFCCLGRRRKVNALCLLYEIYHRVDYPMNEFLNNFVAVRNTRASVTLCELGLVISRCRTDQFSLLFLPAAVRCLWNLLPSGVFRGAILNFFKTARNLCLLRIYLDFFVSLF